MAEAVWRFNQHLTRLLWAWDRLEERWLPVAVMPWRLPPVPNTRAWPPI